MNNFPKSLIFRKPSQLLEADKVKIDLMYHLSPRYNRASIFKRGLVANIPQCGSLKLPLGVYIFEDLENAIFFKDHMQEMLEDSYGYDPDNRLDVWEINTEDLQLYKDPALTNLDEFQNFYPLQPLKAYYSIETLPIQRLSLL